MTFQSQFPSFNRDEVTPSEQDLTPDVQSIIGRTLARMQGFSNILGVFKFLRADYNGRLHVTQAPTDFENFTTIVYTTIVGESQAVPQNPDRQILNIFNNSGVGITILVVNNGVSFALTTAAPGETVQLIGFTQVINISCGVAGGIIDIYEV